jgi:hypothetical protein
MVPGSEQLADPLTKFFVSPTEQWRTAEYLQGTHPAVTAMQQVAEVMGAARKRQQMDYKGMDDVDDGVYVYGGDEEAITNTAMNVCVPCSADDEAMEVTRSRLTSRAGWTDEEHAVGHVLVGGDGGTTSQSAMEVEGETDVNSKRVGRGRRKKQISNLDKGKRWIKNS